MPGFDDIASGLAASLAVLDGFQISQFFLDHPTPDTIQVSGVDEVEYDVAFHSAGVSHDIWLVEIEACLLRTEDISAQVVLRKLMSPVGAGSLKEAIEADSRLTSRMLDDLSIETDQDPACDDLHVEKYQGQARHRLEDGTDVLLATWIVRVLT